MSMPAKPLPTVSQPLGRSRRGLGVVSDSLEAAMIWLSVNFDGGSYAGSAENPVSALDASVAPPGARPRQRKCG